VLGATVGASAKLAMVCALVGWLLRTEQLPNNTAAVMSKAGAAGWLLGAAAAQRVRLGALHPRALPTRP
jgi:hypothetical protein